VQLTPLQRRRIDSFKRNRRGYWSLWIFLLLFGLSLFAELIANDKPLLISHQQQLYWPLLQEYTEADFGGDVALPVDYRDPYIQALIADSGGWALWPPIPFSYDTINYELEQPAPSPPSASNWLGTDD